MNEDFIEGFNVPVFRSLTEKVLWLGAPRMLVILNGFTGVFLFFILQIWYIVILNFILHGLAAMFAKRDPLFFSIFLRYCKLKKYYCV